MIRAISISIFTSFAARFENIVGRLVDVIFGYDFFVSYTWADGSQYAHSLYEKLKAQGFTVFLDEEEFARGDNWTLLGRRALKKTRQLVLVATPRVHESGPVLKELIAFQSTNRRIIPIEIGDALDSQKYSKSPLLPLIPAELLKISQPLQQDDAIPNEAPPEVVRELRRGFHHVRQAQVRVRVLLGACLVLLGLLSIAVWQGYLARTHAKEAIAQRDRVSHALSQSYFRQAQIDLESEADSPDNLNRALSELAESTQFDPLNYAAASRLAALLTYRSLALPLWSVSQKALSVEIAPVGANLMSIFLGEDKQLKQLQFWEATSPQSNTVISELVDDQGHVETNSVTMLDSPTSNLQISPNGAVYAAIGPDGDVAIRRVKSSEIVAGPHNFGIANPSVHFDESDSKAVISSDSTEKEELRQESETRIWDFLKEQNSITEVPGFNAIVSADGRVVATLISWETCRVWSTSSAKPLTPEIDCPRQDEPIKLVLSHDGALLVINYGVAVQFVEVEGGKSLGTLTMNIPVSGVAREVVLNDEGTRVAISHSDSIEIFDTATRKLRTEIAGVGVAPSALQFSQDGNRLLAACGDSVVVWDAFTGQKIVEPFLPERPLIRAKFMGSQRVVTATDHSITMWDVRNGSAVPRTFGGEMELIEAKCSPRGDSLFTISEKTIEILGLPLGTRMVKRNDPDSFAQAWYNSSGSRIIALDNLAKTLRVYDAKTAKLISRLCFEDASVKTVTTGPLDSFAVGLDDGTIHVYTSSEIRRRVFRQGNTAVTALKFIGQLGTTIASASQDGIIRFWNPATGGSTGKTLQVGKTIDVFSGDGRYCAATTDDKIIIFDTAAGGSYSIPIAAIGRVKIDDPTGWETTAPNVIFSPDSQRALTFYGRTARTWDTSTGNALSDAYTCRRDPEFSPTGEVVLSHGLGASLMVVDPLTGTILFQYARDSDREDFFGSVINSSHFSWDGSQILVCRGRSSGSKEDPGQLKLFDFAPNGDPVPEWFCKLAGAMAGLSITRSGIPLPIKERMPIINEVRSYLRKEHSNSKWEIWARWLLADRLTRSTSPLSVERLPGYIQRLLEVGTHEALAEASEIEGLHLESLLESSDREVDATSAVMQRWETATSDALMKAISAQLGRNTARMVPKSGQIVEVAITFRADGVITDATLQNSSGIAEVDSSILEAIDSMKALGALPRIGCSSYVWELRF